jgi:hypothetical protein
MYVDVRADRKLRDSADAQAAFSPIIQAVCSSTADLSRLRMVFDWVQYRNNFREPAACRPLLEGGGEQEASLHGDKQHEPGPPPGTAAGSGGRAAPPPTALEVAVDLRRWADVDLATAVKEALAQQLAASSAEAAAPAAAPAEPALAARARPPGGMMLEPWVPGIQSCIWQFNTLYWQALSHWEKATGREYEQALPGGESDARNREAVRELILELLRIWDDLDARRALPDELYVLELGVGNGNQARTFLDEFAEADRAHGRDYYRRLHYLMGDYSPHVLERARRAVAHHGDHVNALVLDATRPSVTLGFLAGKTFLVYISNVYDNLPTDELACIRGRPYRVEVRAYLRDEDAERIARAFAAEPEQLPKLVSRLLRIGPELLSESMPQHFADIGRAVAFWRDTWAALRLQERYAPLEGLDTYEIAPSLSGEILRPLLEAGGDIRMHVNNGTLSSFADTLPLLHPFGRIQCHDLFLTDHNGYSSGFYGPGKYDGSVVNWVNGPLLRLLGNRRGVDVSFAPFRQRPGSNVKTLTAQVRD